MGDPPPQRGPRLVSDRLWTLPNGPAPCKTPEKVFKRKKSTPAALFMAKIPFWGVPGVFQVPEAQKTHVPENIFVGKKKAKNQKRSYFENFCSGCIGNHLKTILVQNFFEKIHASPEIWPFWCFHEIGAGSSPTGDIIGGGPAVNFFNICFSAKNIPFLKILLWMRRKWSKYEIGEFFFKKIHTWPEIWPFCWFFSQKGVNCTTFFAIVFG